MKFLEPMRKPKDIYTDNSLEFGTSCQELSWNHCTSTPHRSETNGFPQRAVRRVKEGTSAVLLQSALDKEWWTIPWSVTVICETFRINFLMRKHLTKGGSECPLTDLWYRLEQWSNIDLSLRRTYRDYINLVQKPCQVYSLDMRYTREESGKETLWSQTVKNWSRWTHLNFTPEGSMQRKCQRRWKVKISCSQSQMEQSNPLEEIDVWNHPPQSRIILNEERNKKFFEEKQTDSLLQPTSRWLKTGWCGS